MTSNRCHSGVLPWQLQDMPSIEEIDAQRLGKSAN